MYFANEGDDESDDDVKVDDTEMETLISFVTRSPSSDSDGLADDDWLADDDESNGDAQLDDAQLKTYLRWVTITASSDPDGEGDDESNEDLEIDYTRLEPMWDSMMGSASSDLYGAEENSRDESDSDRKGSADIYASKTVLTTFSGLEDMDIDDETSTEGSIGTDGVESDKKTEVYLRQLLKAVGITYQGTEFDAIMTEILMLEEIDTSSVHRHLR